MCPDRQILSVYFDQELPSPWKEKMEKHLADCPACRARFERYRQVSARIAPGGAKGEPGEALRERVWRRISPAGEHDGRLPVRRPEYARKFWRRSLSIPLPAVTAAAAVFLFLLLGLAFSSRPAAPSQAQDNTVAVGIEGDLQSIEPASEMTGILQYLGREDQGDLVIIRLPESRKIM
jgi:anti-sigma factor RsiW